MSEQGFPATDARLLVARALDEDLDGGTDVTTVATIPVGQESVSHLVARADGVVAGLPVVALVVEAVDARLGTGAVRVDLHVDDGARVVRGDHLGTLRGSTRTMLVAERTALNVVSRTSGVATHTRRWADELRGSGAMVLDTRKTTPGMRALEKYAVRCGGGTNKRLGLYDVAMVKDNHKIAAGGLTAAYEAVRQTFPGVPVQVAAGVYGMFEFGRYRAGYDVVAGLRQRAELRNEIATQEATISELRAKVAQLESSTVGQTREREEVQRTIGDLQAQVARANQELAFFRGIVTQNANSAEVKIQQARMVATATANKFRIRVTLVQPMKPDTVVSGVVVLSVDGEVDGKPGRADFATLSGGKRREIPFTFRYLENIEEEITMPPGMKPEQLLVEVRSNRRGSAPVQQSYVWSVDPQ